MISPLGQRQIFQTAHVEAVRQAQEMSEQIQREDARQRVANQHLIEDEANVQVIANSERIQTQEREGRQGKEPRQGASHEPRKDEDEDGPADSAEVHVNFLA